MSAVPADQRFGKRLRVRARREYLAAQRGGRRVSTAHFVVYGRGNGGRLPRLGITVSRKVGKAVLRNRVKRWLREAFRRHLGAMPGGVDLVFVARPESPAAAYAQVEAALLEAVQRLRNAPSAARRRKGGAPGGGRGAPNDRRGDARPGQAGDDARRREPQGTRSDGPRRPA